jgi:hypothetical protein
LIFYRNSRPRITHLDAHVSVLTARPHPVPLRV